MLCIVVQVNGSGGFVVRSRLVFRSGFAVGSGTVLTGGFVVSGRFAVTFPSWLPVTLGLLGLVTLGLLRFLLTLGLRLGIVVAPTLRLVAILLARLTFLPILGLRTLLRFLGLGLAVLRLLLSFAATLLLLPACGFRRLAFLLFLVETGEGVLSEDVGILRLFLLLTILLLEREGLLTGLVEGDDLESACGADSHEVGRYILVCGVGDLTLEDIGLEVMIEIVGGLKLDILGRELLGGFHISVHLEVQTAFQLGALSGKLLGIEGYVLIAGGSGRDADEIGQPGGTAERTATGTYAADASSLLTRTNLLHLDSDLEGLGQHLDKLTEVDTLVGDIIEDGLVAVTLILDIADFHIELEVGGDFAGTNHRVVLPGAGLLVTFKVGSLRLAEDTAGLSVRLYPCLPHLQADKRAGEGHTAYVMARLSLDGHNVADFEGNLAGVEVIALAGVLEIHLHHVVVGITAGDILPVVITVELPSQVTATGATARAAAAL